MPFSPFPTLSNNVCVHLDLETSGPGVLSQPLPHPSVRLRVQTRDLSFSICEMGLGVPMLPLQVVGRIRERGALSEVGGVGGLFSPFAGVLDQESGGGLCSEWQLRVSGIWGLRFLICDWPILCSLPTPRSPRSLVLTLAPPSQLSSMLLSPHSVPPPNPRPHSSLVRGHGLGRGLPCLAGGALSVI